jgi:hypothetical protein
MGCSVRQARMASARANGLKLLSQFRMNGLPA